MAIYGARHILTSAKLRARSIAKVSSFDDHSTASGFSEAIVAKRLGERGGRSVEFRLFRDPETSGSPQGGSLGAAG
jgi:hypothetical protein